MPVRPREEVVVAVEIAVKGLRGWRSEQQAKVIYRGGRQINNHIEDNGSQVSDGQGRDLQSWKWNLELEVLRHWI